MLNELEILRGAICRFTKTKKSFCMNGEKCQYAHNDYELNFHSKHYLQKVCPDSYGKRVCSKQFCTQMHSCKYLC